jgi:hypothetical protein
MTIFIQVKIVQRQDVAWKASLVKKEMILRIPEMEKIQRLRMEAVEKKAQEKQKPLTLEGVFSDKGMRYALINGDIYKEGDALTGYRITNIQGASVVLENTLTKESITLQLNR